MKTEKDLFNLLEKLDIKYTLYEHEPLFTVEQAKSIAEIVPGGQCKNLFLKDSKKNLYLIVACAETKIELKKVSKALNAPELRFADAELLLNNLGVIPGSVTPFGLINNTNHDVKVLLDKSLFNHDILGFHPLRNSATITVASNDREKFVRDCGNSFDIINFESLNSALPS